MNDVISLSQWMYDCLNCYKFSLLYENISLKLFQLFCTFYNVILIVIVILSIKNKLISINQIY